MKTPNKFNNNVGFLALLILLLVTLACSINTGDASESSDNENGDNKEVTIKKKKPKVKKIKMKKSDDAESEKEDKGDFIAKHSTIENAAYVEFDQKMRDENLLESIVDELNNSLSMPEDIEVTFDDCGEANASYNYNNKSITMCYELMDQTYQDFIAIGLSEDVAMQRMMGATVFVFFHELGHCLMDIYKIPALGREEDSADQLSTYILMDDMSEEGTDIAISGVLWFEVMANKQGQNLSDGHFADEHSLGKQRYFNTACWMYGRDPDSFQTFIENGILPERRAVCCQREYRKLSEAWDVHLKPWIKQ